MHANLTSMQRGPDLTGRRFGKIVVEGSAQQGNRRVWICLCDCGRRSVVASSANLVYGRTKSCGCGENAYRVDLTGQRFGRWLVLGRAPKRAGRSDSRWLLRCDCGVEVERRSDVLKSGDTKSCGCGPNKTSTRHGQYKTAAYHHWQSIRSRCNNPSHPNYDRYGGRGIKMCVRWDLYENFVVDMGERPSSKHSIGRIDNDGSYTPENCRWETSTEQARNKSTTVRLTFDSRTMTLKEWCEELGLPYKTAHWRVRQGWTVEEILSPLKKNYRR